MGRIATPVGDARVDIRPASGAERLTLALGHGAGGGIEAADLVALAEGLPPRGITVVRIEQPWRVAGRKIATAPPSLDAAWLAVLEALGLGGPVAVGGRSAGGRVACRTATQVGAVACVALAFPLHPPGRPEKSRLGELAGAGVPTLVVQGDRDAFGSPKAFPRKRSSSFVVHAVPGADHSFRVPRGQDRASTLEQMASTVAHWLLS